jgi:steroid delta-isomerase-like uncharacterized protein
MNEELTKHGEDVRELMRRKVDVEEYRQIRREWIAHSIAEDSRDIPGLLATLTEDCVYELIQTGHKWEGHEGAAAFYTELLTAFPDIHFALQNIVIGPQGVYEEAYVTGTHLGPWLGVPASGRKVEYTVVIYFPWDPAKKKFKGERVMSTLGAEQLVRSED